MNETLHLSENGAKLIKAFESCVLTAYVDTHDSKGNIVWSIGWGHSSALGFPHVQEGMTITQEEADKIFMDDAVIFENKVKRMVTIALNQNQFDALVCMCYNVSTAHFKEMLDISELNKGVYANVPDAMMHYNVSAGRILRGLTRRRKLEGQLFSTPIGGDLSFLDNL